MALLRRTAWLGLHPQALASSNTSLLTRLGWDGGASPPLSFT